MTGTAHLPTAGYRLFPSPEDILAEIPLPPAALAGIARGRAEVRAVLDGTDERLLVITGAPPARDPEAVLEYAERLAGTGLEGDLLIVMRSWPEEPGMVTGRTGELLSGPPGDGSRDAREGLREARRLLAGLAMLGLPAACEWPSPVAPHYLADAVTWSAIDARLTDSQARRRLASALPMPAGFTSTGGDIQVAAEECKAAANGHTYLGITEAGTIGVVTSQGNPACHVILRGSRRRPGYGPQSVAGALEAIEGAGLPRQVVISAAQDGPGHDHRRQEAAAIAVAGQVAGGERGIAGVMLDSLLLPGRPGPGLLPALFRGHGAAGTRADLPVAAVLEILAAAVRARRRLPGAPR